ncbi:aspartate dehydrogenase [Stappia stellulata]|uniref:aspartate dehydrogenase n=1 Tax=Stappia stellulata TaxID=71235 RepID=UPI0003F95106|nr:aspartate dehydrogenase [Stappia stellulata]
MKHVAIIGYGAIARYVMTAIAERDDLSLCGIIGRAGRLEDARACAPDTVAIADAVGGLPQRPDLVLDCAGHAGLRDHGPDILAAGIDLYSVSAGALADAALHDALSAAARRGRAALRIVSGAIGGLDILGAARQGGLTRVVYRGRKPPASWRGTPAEDRIDLDAQGEAQVHFRGNARQAAALYPKNANVTASIALAGIGFDATEVELISDPACVENRHELVAEGAFGSFAFQVSGRAMPDNPKSSALTAMSMVDTLLRLEDPIRIA